MTNDKPIRAIASQDKRGNQLLIVFKGSLTPELVANSGYVNDPEQSPIVDQLKKIMNNCVFNDVRPYNSTRG